MRSMIYSLIVALFVVGSALTAHAAVKDDGLILYFSFDSEKGGMIEDQTGGGNDAEIVKGAKIVTDEVVHGRGAVLFEEAGDSVTADSFKALEDYQDNTYLFWVNFTKANSGGWDQIIAKHAPGSDRSPGIWTCNRVPLHIHYRFHGGNRGTDCAGPDGENDTFEIGEWYHIAGVKKDAQLAFYVNGKKVAEPGVPKDHVQGNAPLYIGKSPSYSAAKFYLDDLYIYNRALDANEVSEVMDGKLLPVEPNDKLTTTWGQVKTRRD